MSSVTWQKEICHLFCHFSIIKVLCCINNIHTLPNILLGKTLFRRYEGTEFGEVDHVQMNFVAVHEHW